MSHDCHMSIQAVASLGDGSPADGVGVAVTVTINNGARVIFDDVVNSTAGSVSALISVPLDTNCMKITVSIFLRSS